MGTMSKEYKAAWRAKNREKIREYRQRAHIKAQHAAYCMAQRRVKPKAYMLRDAKRRAKLKEIPFDLSVDDFEIPKTCPILGLVLESNINPRGPSENSPSLDRIVPEKGYTKGNVAVISMRANRLKSNGTIEEFRALVEWLNNFRVS